MNDYYISAWVVDNHESLTLILLKKNLSCLWSKLISVEFDMAAKDLTD